MVTISHIWRCYLWRVFHFAVGWCNGLRYPEANFHSCWNRFDGRSFVVLVVGNNHPCKKVLHGMTLAPSEYEVSLVAWKNGHLTVCVLDWIECLHIYLSAHLHNLVFALLLIFSTFQWTNDFIVTLAFVCRISEFEFTVVNIVIHENPCT